MYEWLTFSLIWLSVWSILFSAKPQLRKEIVIVSAATSIAGFTEPFFVPLYWNPPSLFNLAQRTGFDIESFIFTFSSGGISSALYQTLLHVRLKKMSLEEIRSSRRWFHFAALATMPGSLAILLLASSLNPIYSLIIALSAGSIAAVACRPDLAKNTLVGGALFAALYFVFFSAMNLLFPSFVGAWNLSALSGVVILDVPIEEVFFAFTFGMFWSGVYEHAFWYKLTKDK